MGYIRHDAIVVTAWDEERLTKALEKAKELELPVSGIVASQVNGYVSFLIAPDGSKEGWDESEQGDIQRDKWKRWVREQKDFWIDWAHISYGGDEPEAFIVDHWRECDA